MIDLKIDTTTAVCVIEALQTDEVACHRSAEMKLLVIEALQTDEVDG